MTMREIRDLMQELSDHREEDRQFEHEKKHHGHYSRRGEK